MAPVVLGRGWIETLGSVDGARNALFERATSLGRVADIGIAAAAVQVEGGLFRHLVQVCIGCEGRAIRSAGGCAKDTSNRIGVIESDQIISPSGPASFRSLGKDKSSLWARPWGTPRSAVDELRAAVLEPQPCSSS